MAINTSIWGGNPFVIWGKDPTNTSYYKNGTVITSYSGFIGSHKSIPESTLRGTYSDTIIDLGTAIHDGVIPQNTLLDTSWAMWGIGINSPMCHPYIIIPQKEGTSRKYTLYDGFYDYTEKTHLPLVFQYNVGSGNTSHYSPTTLRIDSIQGANAETNYTGLRPLINFDYKGLAGIINIIACGDNSGKPDLDDFYYNDMNTYFNINGDGNNDYSDWPWIVGVYISFGIGNGYEGNYLYEDNHTQFPNIFANNNDNKFGDVNAIPGTLSAGLIHTFTDGNGDYSSIIGGTPTNGIQVAGVINAGNSDDDRYISFETQTIAGEDNEYLQTYYYEHQRSLCIVPAGWKMFEAYRDSDVTKVIPAKRYNKYYNTDGTSTTVTKAACIQHIMELASWVGTWESARYYVLNSQGKYSGQYESDLSSPTIIEGQTGNICPALNQVIMPKFNSSGITIGEFEYATTPQKAWNADAQALENWRWKYDPRTASGYTPDTPPEPPAPDPDPQGEGDGGATVGDSGDLTTGWNSGSYEAGVNYFCLTQIEVQSLIGKINNAVNAIYSQYITDNPDGTLTPRDLQSVDFGGSNPFDYVSSMVYIDAILPHTATDVIKLGRYTIPDQSFSKYTGYQYGQYYDLGSATIQPTFNDFRDYNPYTTIELIVPYCGTVELDPALFYGHTLSIKMNIDIATGACNALVYRDNLVVHSLDGVIGVTIPIMGMRMGDYQNTIASLATQRASNNLAGSILKQSFEQNMQAIADSGYFGMLSNIAGIAGAMGAPSRTLGNYGSLQFADANTGNMIGAGIGAVRSGFDTWNSMKIGAIDYAGQAGQNQIHGRMLDYQIAHTAPTPQQLGTASPNNALAHEHDCRILIKRCVLDKTSYDTFGSIKGYACNRTDTLGTFTGFTKCANVKLNIAGATQTEQLMINQLLTSGVYL